MPSKGIAAKSSDRQKPPEAADGWTASAVRALRIGARMNQTEFGKALDVNRSTVVDWEKGKPISPLGIGALNAFRDGREGATKRETLPSKVVRETAPAYGESAARLAGRSYEVELLIAYALERQRALSASLSEAEHEEVRSSLRRFAGEPSPGKEVR